TPFLHLSGESDMFDFSHAKRISTAEFRIITTRACCTENIASLAGGPTLTHHDGRRFSRVGGVRFGQTSIVRNHAMERRVSGRTGIGQSQAGARGPLPGVLAAAVCLRAAPW